MTSSRRPSGCSRVATANRRRCRRNAGKQGRKVTSESLSRPVEKTRSVEQRRKVIPALIGEDPAGVKHATSRVLNSVSTEASLLESGFIRRAIVDAPVGIRVTTNLPQIQFIGRSAPVAARVVTSILVPSTLAYFGGR